LTGWWADANYDSGNTFDRIKYNGIVKASTSITRQSIIVSNGSGFSPLNTGDPFNVNYPILCALDENIVAEGTSLNCYMVCPMSITQTQQIDLIPGKSVYVKGSLSGLTFTPINQLCITQTIPVNEDGYFYLLLGTSFGTGETTRDFYLQADHPIYVYKSGIGFTKVETAALSVAEQTASGFRWVVQSGTSETDFELTDRTAELVSDYINLHGLVEFNGLNSDTKSRINNAQSAANQAQSTADAASASALLANTTINAYKDANNVIIGNQVQDTAVFTGIARFNNLVDG
jgi:hypothetical protein